MYCLIHMSYWLFWIMWPAINFDSMTADSSTVLNSIQNRYHHHLFKMLLVLAMIWLKNMALKNNVIHEAVYYFMPGTQYFTMAVYYFMPGTLGTLQWQYIISCQVHWVPYQGSILFHARYIGYITEVEYHFMTGSLGTLPRQYIISCQVHWVPYRGRISFHVRYTGYITEAVYYFMPGTLGTLPNLICHIYHFS